MNDRPPPEVKSQISFDKFCVRPDRAIYPSNNTILDFRWGLSYWIWVWSTDLQLLFFDWYKSILPSNANTKKRVEILGKLSTLLLTN